MKKHKKEIIKLVTVEFLCSFFDVMTPFFEASSIYRNSTRKYLHRREVEKDQFWHKISYLKKKGLIQDFVENKEKYYELTNHGKKIIAENFFLNFTIQRPEKWDGLWRVVIFDIPEKFRHSRDILREKLYQSNFYQIQRSVYVYPYECTSEIAELSKYLLISKNVIIMISNIIQGEEDIVDFFLGRNVLKKEDLGNKKD